MLKHNKHPDAATVAARVAQLPHLSMEQLWSLWDDHFDERPGHHQRVWLESRLAYRMQERAFGGLDPGKPFEDGVEQRGGKQTERREQCGEQCALAARASRATRGGRNGESHARCFLCCARWRRGAPLTPAADCTFDSGGCWECVFI